MKVALPVFSLAFCSIVTNAFGQMAPPPPISPYAPGAPNGMPQAQSATQQQLNQSEKQDSGRGLEFIYANAEAGFSYMNLSALKDSSLGLSRSDHAGGVLGIGAGVRLLILTLGARFRYNLLSAFNLGQVNAVVGVHIPAGNWDPYFAVFGGYDFIGATGDGTVRLVPGDSQSVAVHGGNVGVSGGIDYYIAKFFSVGLDASLEFLFLKRPQISQPLSNAFAAEDNPLYRTSGSSTGVGVVASLHVGVHF